jgi:hypothetical protein
MADQISVALNPSVVATIQDRTLQRTFRDALFPRLLFRMEANAELWAQNLGGSQTFSRRGLIKPNTRPIVAGQDPTPKTVSTEQWDATAAQWTDTTDTHMPTSYVSLASQYLSNMQALGMHSGQSINRVVRDKLYNAYTAGNTMSTALASATATTIAVANLGGFTRMLQAGRPQQVSPTNPIPITIPAQVGGTYVGTVTGFTSDFAGDEVRSGVLTISPALAGNVPARSAVLANNRSDIVYSGGGNGVDDISSSDLFSLADIRLAIAKLRFNNVPTHEDGVYHWHLDPTSENQIFGDNEFQRLNQSIPDGVHYREFAAGYLLNGAFYRNNEAPYITTCDPDPTVGATHGFEVTNAAGVNVHRPIVTGQGNIEEKYLDESRYISEAGVMGKIGEFAIVNGGVAVMTERIRLTLRAPLDRLQQMTATTWSISGDWPVPTDALAPSSPATYKRSCVVVHGE